MICRRVHPAAFHHPTHMRASTSSCSGWVQELACSLASMSRNLPLAVLLVREELAPSTVQAIEAVARVLYAEPVFFDNVSSKR